MTCQELHGLIHPYLDGELDLVRSLDIDGHLGTCPACAQLVANQRAIQTALRSGSFYYKAPGTLQTRIRSILETARPRVTPFRPPLWAWTAIAASFALVFFLGWQIAGHRPGNSTEDLLVREVISSHVRSLLLANPRTDVTSSNQHTVKPWFQGHLDFSPPVKDLSPDFSLLGGRLDYLIDRPVAALVYQRRAHSINLFIWPAASDSTAGPATLTRQGYHLIHWTEGDLTYWAVSDLNEKELEEFARLFRN